MLHGRHDMMRLDSGDLRATMAAARNGSSPKLSVERPKCHVRVMSIAGPVTPFRPASKKSWPMRSPKRVAIAESKVAAIESGVGKCRDAGPARTPAGPSLPPPRCRPKLSSGLGPPRPPPRPAARNANFSSRVLSWARTKRRAALGRVLNVQPRLGLAGAPAWGRQAARFARTPPKRQAGRSRWRLETFFAINLSA